jgi:hypothetical protein
MVATVSVDGYIGQWGTARQLRFSEFVDDRLPVWQAPSHRIVTATGEVVHQGPYYGLSTQFQNCVELQEDGDDDDDHVIPSACGNCGDADCCGGCLLPDTDA